MTPNRKPRAGRRLLLRLLLALPALTLAVLGVSAVPALAAAPSWSIEMTHQNAYGAQGGVDPNTGSGTTFDRESGYNAYLITVKNTGNETASGATVTDKLPEGLVLAGSNGGEVSGSGWSCPISSQKEVSCTTSTTLAVGASYPAVTLYVHVETDAPLGSPPSGGVVNQATVSGGGATASGSVSDPTAIAEVPFGIQSFTTSVTEESGSPFTQAGGRPFAANAAFTFNYIPNDSGSLRTAGGSPKDIETELPPGFIGDPAASPKCASETFEKPSTQEPCPLETAVGYIHFSYSQGKIEGGRAVPMPSSAPTEPIYNLQPASGYPTSFGFIGSVSYAHFTLSAKVRSDGDYLDFRVFARLTSS